ncbi:GDSL-type esterase/lipase family protein [Lacibacter sp. H407]|uniref:GDSL-type esterase/lipase family protein n=1 Tax=Lacibacter sp. H407 TaxID=3133423 RepID=UPI0030BD0DB6
MFRHFTSEVVLHLKYARKQLSLNHFNLWLLLAFLTYGCQKTSSGPTREGLDTLYPSASTVIQHHNNEWSRNNYIVRINSFRNNPLKFGEIVFIGNSLTEQGGDWSVKFGLNGIRNRGIAGDVTDGVLMRLQEIIYYKPKAVFLLIGVNDIYNLQGGGGITSADYIANNILKITKKIKAGSPSTRIFVQTILPATAEIQMNTQLINTMIKRNGEAGIYTTIDLHAAFTNSQGLMRQDLTTDGLHLNDRGYKVWVDVLDPFVRQ